MDFEAVDFCHLNKKGNIIFITIIFSRNEDIVKLNKAVDLGDIYYGI